MNSMALKSKAKNLAKEKNVTVNEILQNYMFERLLERVSKSKYKDNFIVKGGFLLSSIFGIESRTTIDLDTSIRGIDLEINNIEAIIKEIMNIEVNDNVTFKYNGYEEIIENSQYKGLRIKLTAFLENMKQALRIDIATGDIITPKALDYQYKLLFEDRSIDIYTYNIESMLSEKIHSIIGNNIFNSRMKDYYDVYYFVENKMNDIDIAILKQAVKNTFQNRGREVGEIKEVFNLIKESAELEQRFNSYRKAHTYASDITFTEVIKNIEIIFDLLQ
jgi:Domain of unknown function (DUF1814).